MEGNTRYLMYTSISMLSLIEDLIRASTSNPGIMTTMEDTKKLSDLRTIVIDAILRIERLTDTV